MFCSKQLRVAVQGKFHTLSNRQYPSFQLVNEWPMSCHFMLLATSKVLLVTLLVWPICTYHHLGYIWILKLLQFYIYAWGIGREARPWLSISVVSTWLQTLSGMSYTLRRQLLVLKCVYKVAFPVCVLKLSHTLTRQHSLHLLHPCLCLTWQLAAAIVQ